jgi:hypothetical protein
MLLMLPLAGFGQTVGLRLHRFGTMEKGYILFAPLNNKTTYLVDRCGKKVHSWQSSYQPGLSVYFLLDGTLLRTGGDTENVTYTAGGFGGYIEKTDWDGNVVWHCKISDSQQCAHHDICPMPNGDILVVVWERKSDTAAEANGRKPALKSSMLWSEKVLQIRPKGPAGYDIVWEWHVWDHLVQDYDKNALNYNVVSEHPELININYALNNQAAADWLHINGIAYNEKLDQVMLSVHNFSELWVIDHSTTSAQAAAHRGGKLDKGGDLLYRWGNPAVYGQGTTLDQKFFEQHNAQWIPEGLPHAGKILVFNNGLGRPGGNYSSVEILSPPVSSSGAYKTDLPYLPKAPTWIYKDSLAFFSSLISGAQILPNGNVLICSGIPGDMFEVDSNKNKVWEYKSPVNDHGPVMQGKNGGSVFRCTFIPGGFAGFSGKTLIPGNPIELNPPQYDCYIPADVSKPVITLKGAALDSVEVYHTYADKGVTAKSDFSGVGLTRSGSFYRQFPNGKPTRLGIYDIVYTGTDSLGLADSSRRLVKVIDRTAPVITLTGDSIISICRWAAYREQGYTVTDNYWSAADIKIDTVYSGTAARTISTQRPGVFTIRYTAKDASGNTGHSAYRHITVLQAGSMLCKTGIDENISADQYIKVFPNPTTGIINIHSDALPQGNIELMVSNTLGQLVEKKITDMSYGDISFDLSRQPAGMYFLNLKGAGLSITKQLLLLK